MKLTFKPLGNYIHEVDQRNTDLSITKLMGVNLSKQMMPSVANIVGTDLSVYKVVKRNQFACKLMSVGRDACLPIALKTDDDPVIISSAYYAFEVNNETEIMSDYLMMCFLRPDFDRELWFKSGGDVRGGVSWEDFCKMEIPYLPLIEQQQLVNEYQVISDRIKTLEGITQKIEEIVQLEYLHRFVYSPDKEHWENGTIGDVLQLQRGHDLPKTKMNGGEYPVAGSLETIGFHDQYTTEAPGIVLGRSGNIGNPRLYLCRFWAHNTSLYVKDFKGSEPIWAYYLLKNINYNQFSGGSAVPTLNRNDVHSYSIKIPSVSLQKHFSQFAMPLLVAQNNYINEVISLKQLQDNMLRNFVFT